MFLGSTSYNTFYPNWGAKPYERAGFRDKRIPDFKFNGQSTYKHDYNKNNNPNIYKEFDDKFKDDMKKKNQKGSYASLLPAPFNGSCTYADHYRPWDINRGKPVIPLEEVS